MDRLTSLNVFGRVVECGGFSAAARRLNMSVTMVSNHVQSLEDHLGARLLNRTTRKISLTEIGRAYHERALQILADLEEADRIATAQHVEPAGLLRLYTSAQIVPFISSLVAEFLAAYPAVSIDLQTGEHMVDLIEDGFDLAIRPVPPPGSSLIVRKLIPWRHILSCSPSYLERHERPLVPADLGGHNCLRYNYYAFGEEWRFEAPNGAIESVRIGGNMLSNSGEMLRYLALNGQGIFLVPSFMAADDMASGRLIRLLPDYRPVPFAINAIYPHRQHLAAKVRRFIDMLVERFEQHRRWMDPDQAA